ncbi:cellulase [Choiromyces venosus 120613-1]|uniref:Glucanase n=1 Tax=Choiromyces venosus 120613-1 TaxID=1336337 RepID=A0A3N4K019_9PEZI|nr:cellulase [Choiromyces venosus 120613-1]
MRSPVSLLSAAFLLSPALQALVYGSPLVERTPAPPCNADNPFLNQVGFANPGYAQKLEETIASFLAEGDIVNAAKTRTVQKVSTFTWISAFGDNATGAGASAGELTLADGGMEKYRQFIDQIVATINKPPYDRLDFTIVLEPDSLGNLITNLESAPKCKLAEPAYKEGLSYAISKLQQKNVALYIDAAHSNWLGWPAILSLLFKEVVSGAGPNAKIRGFATNVSNYNGYNATTPDAIYGPGPDNPNLSELRYAKALQPYLEAEGLPAQFIIDQGRSGAQNIRDLGGHWCNIEGAGFGIRPTTQTGDCNIDSLVWVKPGSESDGTSDSSAARFDENCVSSDAHIPAPEAGAWFNDFVKTLVKNSNPPLEES